MEWTDRHCRFFHRLLTRRALIYTEMLTTGAVLHGDRARLLAFDLFEHPVALQLGGSDPRALARSAWIVEDFGYDEINLNVGCPSDRVQEGRFGACLMAEPTLVGDCVSAMKAAVKIPVTVKCRIGIDDQNPDEALFDLAEAMEAVGVDALIVHARKAWLKGLSPKENREIPPLDYELVYRMKRENPGVFVGINGGISDLDQAVQHLAVMDGVMLGRASYHNATLLTEVDQRIYGEAAKPVDWDHVRDVMIGYAERVVASGGRLNHVTRHMVGLFQGYAGARRYRQILSSEATKPGVSPDLIAEAFAAVDILGGPKTQGASSSSAAAE